MIAQTKTPNRARILALLVVSAFNLHFGLQLSHALGHDAPPCAPTAGVAHAHEPGWCSGESEPEHEHGSTCSICATPLIVLPTPPPPPVAGPRAAGRHVVVRAAPVRGAAAPAVLRNRGPPVPSPASS